jgi:glycosyltransferase involved in cell wall biosynthesis
MEHELSQLNRRIIHRILRKLRLRKDRKIDLAARYPSRDYPVVYANTIDTTDLATQFAGPGRRVIHHIHELGYTTELFRSTGMLKEALAKTDAYIAASGAVRDFLVTSIGAAPDDVHLIHEFPVAIISGGGEDKRKSLRFRLGIPQGAFVIGMCGVPHWRKGTDLFVQLAMQVNGAMLPGECHFVWLGGDQVSHLEPLHDAAQLRLSAICHFVPAVTDPDSYYPAFDVFALTSREDPFPVAMLEAAMSGLPVVCFAGSGGAPEFVEEDAGIVVPYLDVAAMARACVALLRDSPLRRRLGDKARSKVMANYTLEIQAPKIRAIIERVFTGDFGG